MTLDLAKLFINNGIYHAVRRHKLCKYNNFVITQLNDSDFIEKNMKRSQHETTGQNTSFGGDSNEPHIAVL